MPEIVSHELATLLAHLGSDRGAESAAASSACLASFLRAVSLLGPTMLERLAENGRYPSDADDGRDFDDADDREIELIADAQSDPEIDPVELIGRVLDMLRHPASARFPPLVRSLTTILASSLAGVADEHHNRYLADVALAHHGYALTLSRPHTIERGRIMLNLANARLGRAQITDRDRDFARARLSFDWACRILAPEGSAHEWASAAYGLGNIHQILGERNAARPDLRKALRCFAMAGEVWTCEAAPRSWAKLMTSAGCAQLRLGQFEAGVAAYQRAIGLFEAVLRQRDRISARARLLATVNRANALKQLGERQRDPDALDRAIAGFHETRVQAEALQDLYRVALTDNHLATVHLIRGEWAGDVDGLRRAHDHAQMALDAFESLGCTADHVMALVNLANAAMSLGQHLDDPDRLVDAGRLLRRAADEGLAPRSRAIVLNNLGEVERLLGELTGDVTHFEMSISAHGEARRLRAADGRIRDLLNSVGNLFNTHAAWGMLRDDADQLRLAVKLLRRYRRRMARQLPAALFSDILYNAGLAKAALGMNGETGMLDEADADLRASLALLPRTAAPAEALRRRAALGRTLLCRERWREAAVALNGVLDEGAAALALLRSPRAQQLALRDLGGIGDDAAVAHLMLGDPGEAVRLALRGRAIVRSLMAVRGSSSRADSVRRARDRAIDAWRRADFTVDGLWERRARSRSAERDVLDRAIARALGTRERAFKRLQGRMAASLGDGGETVDPAAMIPDGLPGMACGALVLLVAATSTAIIGIRPDGTASPLTATAIAERFTRASLERLSDRFAAGLDAFAGDATSSAAGRGVAAPKGMVARWNEVIDGVCDQLGRQLGQAMPDVVDQLGLDEGAELLLLPPGRLAALPVAAMTMADGRMLFERHPIALAQTLKTGGDRCRTPASQAALLAITNPGEEIGADHGRVRGEAMSASPAAPLFPPGRSTDLVGKAAGLRAVRRALGLPVSHFVALCHGVFDPAYPDRSYLELASGRAGPGRLLASELRRSLSSAVSLCVLGACGTGRHDVRTPDEFHGMAGLILDAGVTAVVATLWDVDAEATSWIVHDLVRRQLDGASVAGALRGACLAYRAQAVRDSRRHGDGAHSRSGRGGLLAPRMATVGRQGVAAVSPDRGARFYFAAFAAWSS